MFKKKNSRELDAKSRKKLKAYMVSFWVNLVLPPLKLIVGTMGNSMALIADGINSLSDILSNIVVYIFLRISGKPRDKDHHYGHGKYETVVAFALAAMMIVAAALIIGESIMTFIDCFTKGILPNEPSWAVVVVALVAMIMKEWAYHYTMRKAKETQSEALRAEALDHRSDVFSAGAVLVGAAGSILIGSWGRLLEPLAACIVAILIIRMALEIWHPSLAKLTDGSLSEEIEDEILKIASSVEGVNNPHNLRTRMLGSDVMGIEMDIRVDGNLTLFEAHDYSIIVERKLRERFGEDPHIIIHEEPNLPYIHKVGGHLESQNAAQ